MKKNNIEYDEEKSERMVDILDKLYEKVLKGIPNVSAPVDKMVQDYMSKSSNVNKAAKSLMNHQIAKCTTSGFLSGLAGAIAMPVAIPANITNVLYVQMRMIASLAYMGGYDINCDQVQTMVYACLAGVSVSNVFKKAGINFGEKIAVKCINKIPGKVLTRINQKIGFRFITKFGEKGIINMGKLVPGVGGIIGGGFDFADTRIIAKRAYKQFILGQEDKNLDEIIIDV